MTSNPETKGDKDGVDLAGNRVTASETYNLGKVLSDHFNSDAFRNSPAFISQQEEASIRRDERELILKDLREIPEKLGLQSYGDGDEETITCKECMGHDECDCSGWNRCRDVMLRRVEEK